MISPGMHLFELPAELQENIFEIFVRDTELDEVFLAREVCTTFRAFIEKELLAKTPIARFEAFDACFKPETRPEPLFDWRWKQENAYTFLREHLSAGAGRPDNLRDLGRLLEKILDVLMKFAPQDINSLEIRQQYKDDILHCLSRRPEYYHPGLSENDELLQSDFQLTCDAGPPEWEDEALSHSEDCGKPQACVVLAKDLDGENLSGSDLLAAASAVQNLAALQYYALNPANLIKRGEFLPNAVVAAIMGHKLESFQYLYALVKGQPSPPSLPGPKDSYWWLRCEALATLVCTAIQAGQVEMAKSLFDGFLKAKDKNYERRFELRHRLIENAMSEGSIEMFDYMLSCVLGSYPIYVNLKASKHSLNTGFNEACAAGHAHFVQHILRTQPSLESHFGKLGSLLTERYIGSQKYDDPLEIAAQFGRINILRVLVQNGADLSKRPRRLLEACIKGRQGTFLYDGSHPAKGLRLPVIKFLLANGMPIGRETVFIINWLASGLSHQKLSLDRSITLVHLITALNTSRWGKRTKYSLASSDVQWELKRIIDAGLPKRKEFAGCMELTENAYAWISVDL